MRFYYKILKRFFVFILFFCAFASSAQEKSDTLEVYFRQGYSLWEPNFKNNGKPEYTCTFYDKKFQNSNIPSIFIVPGVVFSKDNYRIGYGGGYYDRWIGKYPENIYIGFAYEVQIIEKFSKTEYDQKINLVITDKSD